MINYSNRFHGHGSLQYLYKKGAAVRTSTLVLRYSRNTRRQQYRLAVVVSKKVSKSAVVRNRIRRRLYECVRILYGIDQPVYDITLLVHDEKYATMPYQNVHAEVEMLLKKAAIIDGSQPNHAIVDKKE